MNHRILVPAFFAAAAALALAAPAPSAGAAETVRVAQAKERAHTKRVQRPRYDSKRVEGARTEDGYRRTTTWTRGEREASRDAVVATDRDNRTRTRDVTWTDPQGRTATANHTRTKTDDGHRRDSVYTGRDGKARSVSDEVSRGDGRYDRTTTVTGADGREVTREAQGSWDAESGTWVREVDIDRGDD